MRIMRLGLLFAYSALLLFVSGVRALQVATTVVTRDPQSVTLLQRSLAALVGTNAVRDVTLNANATWIAGSDNETGTAVLKATSIGQGRIDLSMPTGPRSEIVDISQTPLTGSWSGPDSIWHAMAYHNLFTEPSWFFPTFLVARVLSTSGYAVSAPDSETKNGISVEHVTVYQQSAQLNVPSKLTATLSRIDMYLDASTLLPMAVDFNLHPDSDALTNIPVEITFSNYQNTQGALTPYHIQKFIQDGLNLDFTVTSVQFNTGIANTDFQVQ